MHSSYSLTDEAGHLASIADVIEHTDGYLITRVKTQPNFVQMGYAHKIMKWLCYEADNECKTLYIQPLSSGAMTTEQLIEWYKKFGFKNYGSPHGLMRRLSKGNLAPEVNRKIGMGWLTGENHG